MKIIYVIMNLGSEELLEGRSSQLYTQPTQLRKEILKEKFRLVWDSNLDPCDTGAALYQLS